jgi:hypothetical protein
MTGKFFLTWLVVFVVWMLGSFVAHGVLLGTQYAKLANLFRQPPEAHQYFHFMMLAHVLMAGAFTWIYTRGVEAKPWVAQGVRFGIVIALLSVAPMYLIYYAVQPMPGTLVIQQILYDTIVVVVAGLVVAFSYRNEASAGPRM